MIISIIIAALVAFIGFGLYKASSLKNIQIVKSVTINGSKEEVFNMVRYLKNYPKWSPFLAVDPTQKYEVKGEDGMVGAQYHWDGNSGKDLGFQEIVKIDTFSFVGMQCDIQKPFVAKPTFDYYFTETANGIEVKQDFKVESDLVPAFFMWLFGAKAEMEKTNQKGLEFLKKAIEK
ncbi:MAG: SRPBCC family protein [Bacteroidia bacterium]|nr:SRPBCC family protein [Bacteroidia bacterium]